MVSSVADRCNEPPCEGEIETLTLNDIEKDEKEDSNTTQNYDEYIYSDSSAPSTTPTSYATSRRLSRRRSSSSVSFEKDSLVIFQEMSKLVDEEENQEHDDNNNTDSHDEERGISGGNGDNNVEESTADLISQQATAVRRRSSRVSICSLASVREEGSNNGSDDEDDENDEDDDDDDDANGLGEQQHHHHTNTESYKHSMFDSSILPVTMKFDKLMLDQRAYRRANDQNASITYMAHSVSVPSSLHELERLGDKGEESSSNLPSRNANSIVGTFRRGRRKSVSFDVR